VGLGVGLERGAGGVAESAVQPFRALEMKEGLLAPGLLRVFA
jgi:hypothetical protein